jgi:hypothetical protein
MEDPKPTLCKEEMGATPIGRLQTTEGTQGGTAHTGGSMPTRTPSHVPGHHTCLVNIGGINHVVEFSCAGHIADCVRAIHTALGTQGTEFSGAIANLGNVDMWVHEVYDTEWDTHVALKEHAQLKGRVKLRMKPKVHTNLPDTTPLWPATGLPLQPTSAAANLNSGAQDRNMDQDPDADLLLDGDPDLDLDSHSDGDGDSHSDGDCDRHSDGEDGDSDRPPPRRNQFSLFDHPLGVPPSVGANQVLSSCKTDSTVQAHLATKPRSPAVDDAEARLAAAACVATEPWFPSG